MNDHLPHSVRHGQRKRKGDTAQLAALLAPLEELNKSAEKQQDDVTGLHPPVAHQEVGAIVVEADGADLVEDQRPKQKAILGLEPVVVVIVSLLLGFIAFIAWQISNMPAQ